MRQNVAWASVLAKTNIRKIIPTIPPKKEFPWIAVKP